MYYTMKKHRVITVRLGPEEERLLQRAMLRLDKSRSEVVREAIARYAEHCLQGDEKPAADRLGQWIGVLDSHGMRLSERTGSKFKELLKERRESGPR